MNIAEILDILKLKRDYAEVKKNTDFSNYDKEFNSISSKEFEFYNDLCYIIEDYMKKTKYNFKKNKNCIIKINEKQEENKNV